MTDGLIALLRAYAQADDLHVDERDALLAAAYALKEAQENTCVALIADIRFACGDNGRRMQPELVEYIRELAEDAKKYRELVKFVLENNEPSAGSGNGGRDTEQRAVLVHGNNTRSTPWASFPGARRLAAVSGEFNRRGQ